MYENLKALRLAVTSDDANDRAEAYQNVLDAGIDPSDVRSPDPPVQELRDAGIIPEEENQAPPASELRQRQVELLEDIRDAVSGGES